MGKPLYGPKDSLTRDIERVIREYTKEYGIYGGAHIVVKALFFIAIYWVLWSLLVFGNLPPLLFSTSAILLGAIGIPGIGFNVFHDGSHGSASEKRWVNRTFARTGNMVGIMECGWDIQHNQLHHSHTNIEGWDPDIEQKVFRTQSVQKVRWFHKYQHIYCWALYLFQAIYWIWPGDFKKTFGRRVGPVKLDKKKFRRFFIEWLITKTVHVIVWFVIPITLLGLWKAIGLYVLVHAVAGIVLASVFQLAHQVTGLQVHASSSITSSWVRHEVETTANFKVNWLFSEFLGGLNFQIEHHLARNLSHIHYKRLSERIREVCRKHDVSYHEKQSFFEAIGDHIQYFQNLAVA